MTATTISALIGFLLGVIWGMGIMSLACMNKLRPSPRVGGKMLRPGKWPEPERGQKDE